MLLACVVLVYDRNGVQDTLKRAARLLFFYFPLTSTNEFNVMAADVLHFVDDQKQVAEYLAVMVRGGDDHQFVRAWRGTRHESAPHCANP